MEPITVEADDNLFSYIKTTVKNKDIKNLYSGQRKYRQIRFDECIDQYADPRSLKASNHSRIVPGLKSGTSGQSVWKQQPEARSGSD